MPSTTRGAKDFASGKGARKVNPALQKPLQPSKELAAVVGSDPLPRGEVVSRVWDYIKRARPAEPEEPPRDPGRRQAQADLRQGQGDDVRDEQVPGAAPEIGCARAPGARPALRKARRQPVSSGSGSSRSPACPRPARGATSPSGSPARSRPGSGAMARARGAAAGGAGAPGTFSHHHEGAREYRVNQDATVCRSQAG